MPATMFDENGVKISPTKACARCGSGMVFDNAWWCRNCEMRVAAERREAAHNACRALIMEEARDFRRNGP